MGTTHRPLKVFLIILLAWWGVWAAAMKVFFPSTVEWVAFAYISAWCASMLTVNALASFAPRSHAASHPFVRLLRRSIGAPVGVTTLTVTPGVVAVAILGWV